MSLPSIDAGSNRYAASQGYAFDKNGNVTTDPESGGRSFTFNGDNKQTQVKDSNNYTIGSYSYDGNAKRVKKVTDLETTVFVYDGFDKLVAEYSTATPPSNPTINYTATDQLGSPRVLTDAFGSVVSRRDFMPFGEELYADGTHRKAGDHYSTSGQDDVRQRFTGYQRDSETGLDFAEARYYNNQHGRFTAVDPLLASGKSANPQTFNRYAYGLNRPLVLNDPTGLQAGTVVTGTTYYNPSTDIYQIGPGTGFVKYDGPSWSGVNRAGRYIEMRQNGWTDYGTARPVTSSDQAPEGFVRSIAKLLKNIAIPAADVVNTYHEVMRDPQIQIPLAMTVIGAPLVAEEQILATETRLADDALVVRGGVVTTEQIIAGAEALDTDGNVLGVSVRSAEGLSEAELAAGGVGARPFPNGQIGVTTAGEIRGVGGTIERTPRPDNIYHCDICGPPQPLADVFEQKPNPVKRPQ